MIFYSAAANQAEIDRAIAAIREAEERGIRVTEEEERRVAEEHRKAEHEKRLRAEQTSRAGVQGAAAKFEWTAKVRFDHLIPFSWLNHFFYRMHRAESK